MKWYELCNQIATALHSSKSGTFGRGSGTVVCIQICGREIVIKFLCGSTKSKLSVWRKVKISIIGNLKKRTKPKPLAGFALRKNGKFWKPKWAMITNGASVLVNCQVLNCSFVKCWLMFHWCWCFWWCWLLIFIVLLDFSWLIINNWIKF